MRRRDDGVDLIHRCFVSLITFDVVANLLLLTDGLLALRQRSTEQQDVGFRLVDHVMNPAVTLLHADVSPFRLGHQVRLGHAGGDLLRQDDVPILERLVEVFVAVVDVVGRHDDNERAVDSAELVNEVNECRWQTLPDVHVEIGLDQGGTMP